MHYASFMTEFCSLKNLVKNTANLIRVKSFILIVKVLLHIEIEVLKDEKQAVILAMNNFYQVYNVRRPSQLLQNSYFADGSARYSIVTMVNLNLLDCDNLLCFN